MRLTRRGVLPIVPRARPHAEPPLFDKSLNNLALRVRTLMVSRRSERGGLPRTGSRDARARSSSTASTGCHTVLAWLRRSGREVEGDGLEIRWSASSRGFESHLLRRRRDRQRRAERFEKRDPLPLAPLAFRRGDRAAEGARLLSECGVKNLHRGFESLPLRPSPRVARDATASLSAETRPWLNWIEHRTTDPKVTGSNPVGRTQ